MKNFIATFTKSLLFTFTLLLLCFVPVMAQGTVDTTDPGSFIDPKNTSPLLIGITTLLAYFSGVFPGLSKINVTWLRSAVVAVVVVAGAATFKFGFFTKETIEFIVDAIFPNFAYSGFVYEALKAILRLFNVELKSLKPGTTAA